jgi:hypothetical protein
MTEQSRIIMVWIGEAGIAILLLCGILNLPELVNTLALTGT